MCADLVKAPKYIAHFLKQVVAYNKKKYGPNELVVLGKGRRPKTSVPWVCFYCLHLTRDYKKEISSQKISIGKQNQNVGIQVS